MTEPESNPLGLRYLRVPGAERWTHLIPADDGMTHAPATECGCGPHLVAYPPADPAGPTRFAYVHFPADDSDLPDRGDLNT